MMRSGRASHVGIPHARRRPVRSPTFVKANPVADPSPEDFEPDGDWYSMVARGGMLYAVDANGGQVVTVQPNGGRVDRIVDISATEGHIVPTAITEGNGRFFLGNLTTFPSVPGSAKILELKTEWLVLGVRDGIHAYNLPPGSGEILRIAID